MVPDHRELIRRDPFLNQAAYNYYRLIGYDASQAQAERGISDEEGAWLEAEFLRRYPQFIKTEGAH